VPDVGKVSSLRGVDGCVPPLGGFHAPRAARGVVYFVVVSVVERGAWWRWLGCADAMSPPIALAIGALAFVAPGMPARRDRGCMRCKDDVQAINVVDFVLAAGVATVAFVALTDDSSGESTASVAPPSPPPLADVDPTGSLIESTASVASPSPDLIEVCMAFKGKSELCTFVATDATTDVLFDEAKRLHDLGSTANLSLILKGQKLTPGQTLSEISFAKGDKIVMILD